MDLIIANPPSPSRNHTTLVIGHAATYDTADDWPFDDTYDPAIIKTTDTAQSAGKDLPGKQSAALEHGNALVLRHPDRIDGSRIIVYDDICTTGLQLNAVAQRLREWGAGLGAWCRSWPPALERRQQLIVAASSPRGELHIAARYAVPLAVLAGQGVRFLGWATTAAILIALVLVPPSALRHASLRRCGTRARNLCTQSHTSSSSGR